MRDAGKTVLSQSICRLCRKECKLVDSHIYPLWFIKDHLQSRDGPPHLISSSPGVFRKRLPKGFSERILCSDCDNRRIGGIEGTASKLYRQMKRADAGFCLIPALGYYIPLRHAEDVHHFALSLVFRMLVSRNDFFRLLKHCPDGDAVASRIGEEILSRTVSRQMIAVFRGT